MLYCVVNNSDVLPGALPCIITPSLRAPLLTLPVSITLFAGSWHAVRCYVWETPNIHQWLAPRDDLNISPYKQGSLQVDDPRSIMRAEPSSEGVPDCSQIHERRADDGLRTRDLQLGKLALYQLSYVRVGRDSNMAG